MNRPYPLTCCLHCASYLAPPEDSRRRADEGYCKLYKQGVNERDKCDEWRGVEEE